MTAGSPVEGEELLPAEREAQLGGLEAELFGQGSSLEGSSPSGSPPAEGTDASSSSESALATSGSPAEGEDAELFGEGSSLNGSPPAEETDASLSLSGSLVTPGSPVEGEQLEAQEQAKLASPEAVAAREASRTEFEDLDSEQAAKVAGEAFPAAIDEPAGGPPKLPAGESVTGYLTDDAAQVDLGEGKRGVIESMAPMAVESAPGERAPLDLRLNDVGSAFEPKTPAVGVRIPKRLGEGVALASTGVSLTPVDAQGSPLGGSEGVIEGASVFYANTQTDADTLVKPTTAGFEANTLLRSVESPRQLYFRVGLPAGASLVTVKEGSGAVEVVDAGETLATIAAPTALDAEGTSVPASMSVSGDVLAVDVAAFAGRYRLPIAVDPTIEDYSQLGTYTDGSGTVHKSGWYFQHQGITPRSKWGSILTYN